MAAAAATCLTCGLPLQKATKYVAIVDVTLGVLSIIVVVCYMVIVPDKDKKFHSSILTILLICFAVQAGMGLGLYLAAGNKSRSFCRFWLVVTLVTAIPTGIVFRAIEMIIVYEFCSELKLEQEVTYFTGQGQGQGHGLEHMALPMTKSGSAGFLSTYPPDPAPAYPNSNQNQTQSQFLESGNGNQFGFGDYNTQYAHFNATPDQITPTPIPTSSAVPPASTLQFQPPPPLYHAATSSSPTSTCQQQPPGQGQGSYFSYNNHITTI